MKTGLVLEGGAMRGMFTAGVLDSWMDEQISFDGIVGVSGRCAVWDQCSRRSEGTRHTV